MIKTETKLLKILKNSLPKNIELEKIHQGRFSQGKVDCTGCYKGLMLKFELKIAPNTVTKLQKVDLLKWARVGAYSAEIVWEKDDTVWVSPYTYPLIAYQLVWSEGRKQLLVTDMLLTKLALFMESKKYNG